MSAVIWCGIVAVWVFVLIPTWVRRGDIHWHRGTVVAAGPVAKPAKGSGRRLHLPRLRHRRRSLADQSIEVEAMAEQEAVTEVTHAQVASRERVAAAPRSGRLGAARASFGLRPGGSGKKKPPLHVRRARRLVGLIVLAFVTLIVAIASGGFAIVVHIAADIAVLMYFRHLRAAARARQAKIARERRARVARQAWDRASAQERASEIDGWQAPESGSAAPPAAADAPAQVDLTEGEQGVIDLTDTPTEELVTARAS
jgi:hypothetical protein